MIADNPVRVIKDPNCGVYKIENIITGDCYIGSSTDLIKRKRSHWTCLRGIRHRSIEIQKAWNEYPEEVFEFVVLELCEKDKLLINEQKYIDKLKPRYNRSPTAGSTKGLKWSEESKEDFKKIHGISQRRKLGMPVIVLDLNGNLIMRHGSISEVAEWDNTSKALIFACINNVKGAKVHNGHTFVYEKDYKKEENYAVKRKKRHNQLGLIAYKDNNAKESLEFESGITAAKFLGKSDGSGIFYHIRNNTKSYKGYKWEIKR